MHVVLIALSSLCIIFQIHCNNSTNNIDCPNGINRTNSINCTKSINSTTMKATNDTDNIENLNTTELAIISKDQEEDVKNLHTILPDGTVHHTFFNPALRNWRTVPPEEDIDVLETRIVGGRNAKPGEHPFQVALMLDEFGLWCGGVIYSRDTILTAAHCFHERKVVRIPFESFAYSVGKQDLRVMEAKSEQLSSSASVKLHPNYSPETGYYDIAVVKLVNRLCFNKYVQPIRIADGSQSHSGDASVTGWGYTLVKSEKNTPADEEAEMGYKRVLEETTVQILAKEACRKHYAEDIGSRGFAKHPSILCAGHKPGGRDACTGDSGGPLVCTDNRGEYLCGIVVTGVGCGLPNKPAFYANITYFYNWILEHAGPPEGKCI